MHRSLARGFGLLIASLLLILLFSSILFASSPVPVARATELTVCPAGPPDCGYSSVQEAVLAASDGDVIKIAAGTYTGVQNIPALNTDILTATQVVAIDKSVTLRGGYTVADWNVSDPVANPTTLDAEGLGRVVLVSGPVNATLEGLYMVNGYSNMLGGKVVPQGPVDYIGDVGGGIYVVTATITISNCDIVGNRAPVADGHPFTDFGGGMYSRGPVTLTASRITDNEGSCNGGVYLDNVEHAVIEGNLFHSNQGPGHCYWGGALFATGRDVLVSHNTFSDNYAYGGGGFSAIGDVTAVGNLVTRNSAFYGGGICVLTDSRIPGTPVIAANVITDNSTAFRGGGIVVRYWAGSGKATLRNNIIAGNTDWNSFCGPGAGGTALYTGGGVGVDGSHNTIVDNRSLHCDGAAITVDGVLTMTNNIIVSHTLGISVTEYGGAWLDGTLWGVGDWANGIDWAAQGPIYTGTTNVWADPLFVDPTAGDYHIQSASPAVDAGVDSGVSQDIDGDFRPFGAGADIGADEWATAQVSVDPATGATLVAIMDGLPTTIDFPAGSVTDPVVVEYTALGASPEDAPTGLAFAGQAFSLDAYQDSLLLPGLTFVVPVTITLEYSDGDVSGLDEASLLLEWWTGSEWEDAACGPYDRDLAENSLSVPICHLSQFGVFGETTASTIYLPLVLRNSP